MIGPMSTHASGLVLCVRQAGDEALAQLLARLQLGERPCADGAAVLAEAAAGTATAVLAPARLADMGVGELIQKLRPVAPGLAVLVLTDRTEMSSAVELMRQGAHAVVDRASLESELPRQLAALIGRLAGMLAEVGAASAPELLGIGVLDHVIVGSRGAVSFRSRQLL